MSWLHYLVEANIYLGVFYLCYCLFLTRETHYALGRFYLLFSCIFAFVLPFTQISILKPVEPVVQQIQIATLVTNADTALSISLSDILFYAYILGGIIALLVFMLRFYRLFRLSQGRDKEYISNYKLIRLEEENTAFSFFNSLYIGNSIAQSQTVIAHELVHIRQKHSWDILFIELLKIVSWFNPFIYLLQNSLKTIHEYIADEQTAAKEQDALAYSSFLLSNAYGIQGSSIAHSFFNYNLLKKRIIMLNQKRSGRLARLKYLAVIPLCGGMLCTSTLVFSKDYGFIDLAPRKVHILPTVAIKPVAIDTVPGKVLPPPPPPASPKKLKDQIKLPPPPPKKLKDQVKLPPASPARPKKLKDQIKLPPSAKVKVNIKKSPDVAEIEIASPPPPPADLADVTKTAPLLPPLPPVKAKKINRVSIKLAAPTVENDTLSKVSVN